MRCKTASKDWTSGLMTTVEAIQHGRIDGAHALLAAAPVSVKEAVLEHRGIKLDLVGRTVHLAGEPVDLTSREFALLEIFMQNVGRILSRKLICEKCWSSHYDHEANLLDVYMSRLRAKFEAIQGPPVFKTVRGVGYQLL